MVNSSLNDQSRSIKPDTFAGLFFLIL